MQPPQSQPSVMPGQPLPSQGMQPGVPQETPGAEFISPEERQQLQELLDATKEKMGELQTAKFASGNAREIAKLDALKEVFQMMKEAGVDLMSQESVAAFIERMKSTNPAMAEQFESSLDSLLGQDTMEPGNQEQAPAGMFPGVASGMTPPPSNETVPQDLRGPVPPTQVS